MKKGIFLLLTFLLLLTMVSTNMAFGASSGPPSDHTERPMQSETEFVVALDPQFVDQWLLGQKKLFVIEDEEVAAVDQQKPDEKSKKLPPGLLKKALDGKEVHIKNLERYATNHNLERPVLITVEVEDKSRMQEARALVEMCEGVLYTDPRTY
jgi:hypothetical protein